MLNPDFSDMLLCLKDEKVEFIIVGAYALAAHGFPRATGDIDIWVRNTPENARSVVRALAKFGAPLSNVSEDDFTARNVVLQIGIEPSRIDLMTSIDGVQFAEAWKSRTAITIGDLEIDVLSREDLIKNKLATGRKQDELDARSLQDN
jgi:Nucleotidyl transferase of unknown function (DUF2204)